ncbi:MAG: hypothetical protein CM1200mP29_01820 [Verrucomicrobiota bacterium]|nr:MAG: hypothetical protein CM1200mP29_01820 [Verrucomicrobiota bacterium]
MVKNYPGKRSAALMVLHALQEEFGQFLSRRTMGRHQGQLAADQIHELVTFYPMLREQTRARRWDGFAEL